MKLRRDNLEVRGEGVRTTITLGADVVELDIDQARWLAFLALPTLLADPQAQTRSPRSST